MRPLGNRKLSAVEEKGGVMAHPNEELVRKGFDAFSKATLTPSGAV
jgi:hypothetical protein